MKIINQTQNTILAEEIVVADTFFKRLKGLLGKKEFKTGQALLLKPANSIHTFFMAFPIDILFVAKDNRVIKAISFLKPFCFTAIYFKAAYAIELPAGVIQSSLTVQGDVLSPILPILYCNFAQKDLI